MVTLCVQKEGFTEAFQTTPEHVGPNFFGNIFILIPQHLYNFYTIIVQMVFS